MGGPCGLCGRQKNSGKTMEIPEVAYNVVCLIPPPVHLYRHRNDSLSFSAGKIMKWRYGNYGCCEKCYKKVTRTNGSVDIRGMGFKELLREDPSQWEARRIQEVHKRMDNICPYDNLSLVMYLERNGVSVSEKTLKRVRNSRKIIVNGFRSVAKELSSYSQKEKTIKKVVMAEVVSNVSTVESQYTNENAFCDLRRISSEIYDVIEKISKHKYRFFFDLGEEYVKIAKPLLDGCSNLKKWLSEIECSKDEFTIRAAFDRIIHRLNRSHDFPKFCISIMMDYSESTQREFYLGQKYGMNLSVDAKNKFKKNKLKESYKNQVRCIVENCVGAFGLDNFKATIIEGDGKKKTSYDYIDAHFRKLTVVGGIVDSIIPKETVAVPMDLFGSVEKLMDVMKMDIYKLMIDQNFFNISFKRRQSLHPFSPKYSFVLPLESLRSSNYLDSIQYYNAFRFLDRSFRKSNILVSGVFEMTRFLGDCQLVETWKNTISAVEWFLDVSKEKRKLLKIDFDQCSLDLEFWRNSYCFKDWWHNLKVQVGKFIGAVGEMKLASDLCRKVYWIAKFGNQKSFPANFTRTQKSPYPIEKNFPFSDKIQLLFAFLYVWSEEGYREKFRTSSTFSEDTFLVVSYSFEGEICSCEPTSPDALRKKKPGVVFREVVYPGGRFQMLETFYSHLVPTMLSQLELLCVSENEEDVLSVLFSVFLNNKIIGTPKYETLTVDLINLLIYERKYQPDLYKFHLKNLKFLQNVAIEYVHSILSVAVDRKGKDSLEGINELIQMFTDIRDARTLDKEWYGHEYKKTYDMNQNFKFFVPAVREVLNEYLVSFMEDQKNFERNKIYPKVSYVKSEEPLLLIPTKLKRNEIGSFHYQEFPGYYLHREAVDSITDFNFRKSVVSSFPYVPRAKQNLKDFELFSKTVTPKMEAKFSKIIIHLNNLVVKGKSENVPFPLLSGSEMNRLWNINSENLGNMRNYKKVMKKGYEKISELTNNKIMTLYGKEIMELVSGERVDWRSSKVGKLVSDLTGAFHEFKNDVNPTQKLRNYVYSKRRKEMGVLKFRKRKKTVVSNHVKGVKVGLMNVIKI